MKPIALLTPLLLSLILIGCETTPLESGEPIMTMNTMPQGATVSFASGFKCDTPCKVIVRAPLDVNIAKAGYLAEKRTLEMHPSGSVTWSLTLAAPTTEVEEEALPDLQ